MARKRRTGVKPKVSWPDLRKPLDEWSMGESRAVAINPVVTGIGTHPRTVSDEDWAVSCERDIEANGLAQFLTDLLHVLRLTIPIYLGPSPPVGQYPPRRTAEDVPLPNVAYPGDRGWGEEEWTEEMVGGILCNPIYAGIPPFPAMVNDKTWIEAGIKLAKETGIRRDCARKLQQVEVSGQFTAILACLLDEDWTEPRIEELFLSPDHCLLARLEGQVTHQQFLGAEEDLLRNVRGIAEVAELDGDELGYPLGKIASIKRIE